MGNPTQPDTAVAAEPLSPKGNLVFKLTEDEYVKVAQWKKHTLYPKLVESQKGTDLERLWYHDEVELHTHTHTHTSFALFLSLLSLLGSDQLFLFFILLY